MDVPDATSTTPSSTHPPFVSEKHKAYIVALSQKKESFEYWVTEHLRMSAMYWGLCSLDIMNSLHLLDPFKEGIIQWILKCQHPNGSFGGNMNHDGHLLYTLSAVQILAMLDAMDRVDKKQIIQYIVGLQQPDGSFAGDEWGEVDTRLSYCALNCLSLLGGLGAVDVAKAVEWVVASKNFDGAFGCVPGAESHGGQTFCCVAFLAIANSLSYVDADLLGWWLCERQVETGGLNGRPEKLADVCYSWWDLSALSVLKRMHWIDAKALEGFILDCQDPEKGGIADRPGDVADVFHTYFGIGGLSLLGHAEVGTGDETIDPVYALTRRTLKRLGITPFHTEVTSELNPVTTAS
eukprot:TRINITY_DN7571_c0_g1_i1.p1 TRINITY_DN7571_c0_g1~~TRINITY_DN7571_c0_g1_i1.p1  ORF type:complete len:350 (-),score=42.32 TRINITY_DN7571_c0_g1_i1:18-1067(-)